MFEKRKLEEHNNLVLVFALLIVSLLLLYFTPSLLPEEGNAITGFAASQVGNLSVGVATYIACTWSNPALTVSFGSSLNPGTNDTNASNNYAGLFGATFYNVTVDTLSNVQANITMKGEDFISGANKIAISNVSWTSNSSYDNDNGSNMKIASAVALTNIFNNNTPIAAYEPIGSTAWFRFWIDVPASTVAGTYLGNYTQQCITAS